MIRIGRRGRRRRRWMMQEGMAVGMQEGMVVGMGEEGDKEGKKEEVEENNW